MLVYSHATAGEAKAHARPLHLSLAIKNNSFLVVLGMATTLQLFKNAVIDSLHAILEEIAIVDDVTRGSHRHGMDKA